MQSSDDHYSRRRLQSRQDTRYHGRSPGEVFQNISRICTRIGLCIGVALLSQTSGSHAAEGQGRQALTTSLLRVCADPSNLPFSNENLEGFENQIITLLGEHLDLEVRYTWFPLLCEIRCGFESAI